MKNIKVIALALTCLFAVQACNSQSSTTKSEGFSKGQLDTLSMAIGTYFGTMIKESNMDDVDLSIVSRTMESIRKGDEPKINPMQINEIINSYMTKKQAMLGEANQKKGADFLAQNKTKPGVVELPDGLQYKITEEGTGIQPAETDTVTVHYTGTLIDGTKFDSSYDRGEPAVFPLNGVIKGWTEGFQHFKEGTKATLYIPADLAYGAQQASQVITPYSTLIFEVELLKVSKAVPQPEKTK